MVSRKALAAGLGVYLRSPRSPIHCEFGCNDPSVNEFSKRPAASALRLTLGNGIDAPHSMHDGSLGNFQVKRDFALASPVTLEIIV